MEDKYLLTDKDINGILQTKNGGARVTTDADVEIRDEYIHSSRYITYDERNKKYKFICFCKKSKGVMQNGHVCKWCGNGLYKNPSAYITSSAVAQKYIEGAKKKGLENEPKIQKDYTALKKKKKESVFSGFYVKKHPKEETGILIFKVQIYLNVEGEEYTISHKIEYITEAIPGKDSHAYKVVKKELIPEDAFTALNLSSNTKKYDANVVYEDADNFVDFCLKNRKFSNYTAFLEMHNNITTPIPKNSFFLFYAYIYIQYPVIEFLAKMKYFTLLTTMFESIINCPNKLDMQMEAEKFQKLFNNDTTKGSMALNMPKYVADYLNEAKAPYNVFLQMCDLYQVNNFSKEDFEILITHEEVHEILNIWNFGRFADVVKHGYSIKKLMAYLNKHKSEEHSIQYYMTTLRDYNTMLKLMGAENIDLYPGDPIKAHDHVVSIYSANKNTIETNNLKALSEYIEEHAQVEDANYVLVVPKTATDFVNEGQAQHNCVEHYYKKMANQQTIVFFIRRKEAPNESFVTVEYNHGHLPQIMYKYNKVVRDKDVILFAQKVAAKMQKLNKLKNI